MCRPFDSGFRDFETSSLPHLGVPRWWAVDSSTVRYIGISRFRYRGAPGVRYIDILIYIDIPIAPCFATPMSRGCEIVGFRGLGAFVIGFRDFAILRFRSYVFGISIPRCTRFRDFDIAALRICDFDASTFRCFWRIARIRGYVGTVAGGPISHEIMAQSTIAL